MEKWVKSIREALRSRLRGIYRRGESDGSKAGQLSHNEPKSLSSNPSLCPHTYRSAENHVSQRACGPQVISVSHNDLDQQPHGRIRQLSPIYSGIGLGVYQGEAVVFLQMAMGERRWLVSKLRFADLNLLPSSLQQDLALLSCLIYLNGTQSDLVKKGLQTLGAIELMRTHCPLVHNQSKSQTTVVDGDTTATAPTQGEQIAGEQSCQVCSLWQRLCPCSPKSIIEESEVQP